MAKGDLVMDSLDELDDFSDSGSDYEDTLKSIKRIKRELTGLPPPKRPRRKAAMRVTPSPCSSPTLTPPDPSLQTQHSRGTSWQASSKPVTSRIQDIRAEDIYNAIYSGKTAVVTVVDEWLDSYKQSREAGLLVLINFIVQSCGCKGVVTKEMMGSMQNAEIIGTLTNDFNEDSVNYPLCTVGPQLKRFKAGLCEFAQILVRSCRNGLVYDEYLFPSLLSLLTGLSDSQVRAFRHTSTLLAMKLMTGLVEVAVIVTCQLQTTQRRWDAERSKDAHDRAPDRLEELQTSIREERYMRLALPQNKRSPATLFVKHAKKEQSVSFLPYRDPTQLRENREELSSMMNATFRGVFVHRYRDQLQEIRAVCIEELGTWLKTDPDHFLNDGCLKYLGWTLHDKQSPVRLQCVQALQGLYQEKEFIGRLELFTSRFKERMLNMVLDKDSNVAVEVVNLLLMIQQGTEEGLREEECGHIYPLVYTSHRGLASAAGRFLYNKLKSVMPSDNQKKGMRGNSALFQIIISFYIQSEFHEHGAYLVDSLWDVAGSELKDWGTMTTFLLQEESLMYEEEGALIEIMICAIRQATEVIPPVGRTLAKKVLSVKDKKIQEQDRRRITTHFIPLLPQLLAKYSADAGKVALLLKAPLYFDLKTYYSTQLMEKHLDSLLSQICGIVEKHTDAAVLQACALLVSTLCSDQYAFSTRVHLVFSQLLDTLTECFSTYLNNLLQDTADDDDIYSAATALKRIAALSSAKDPTRWKLFDPCIELLKIRMESRDFEDLMVAAMKCAALHLMWAKVNVVHSTPPEEELEHLKKGVRTFCRTCQKYLFANQIAIRDQAFELLCDLLLLYSANSVQSQPHLQALYHLPSDSLRSELAAFLLDYIFTDTDTDDMELDDECFEEMKMTLLQKKRNQLAGFCKLVIYGVLDLSAATDVLKHYSQYFRDFGDIIKETVSKTKLINPVQSAKTVCLCLQQMFSEMLTEIHNKQDLGTIRDLAKRLAMSFGIDLHRVREPLMALHLDGIRFALRESEEEEEQYPNAAFMEILCEFSFKLLQEDRKQLASFLKSEYPSTALSWPSVKMYQRSLEGRSVPKPREVEDRSEAISSRITPIAKRKRTVTQGSEASTAAKSLLDTSSIPSGLTTPAFTSTTQKQKAAQLASRRPSEDDAASSFPTEQDSEGESSLGSGMRRVKPIKRHPPPYNRSDPNMQHKNLDSYFTILSLIEDDIAEEEAEIENFESDDESDLTLPSTRYTAASVLDELFD